MRELASGCKGNSIDSFNFVSYGWLIQNNLFTVAKFQKY